MIGRKLLELESDVELAFIVGRTLAALRPDHLLRWPNFVPTLAELEIAVRAAIRLVDPERPIPAELTAGVEQYAGHLSQTLPPQVLEQISVLVKRFAAAHGGDPGAVGAALPRWARAACLTTIRAGPAAGGRVSARLAGRGAVGEALTCCATCRLGMRSYSTATSLRDLAAWSTSQGYSELRAALGLRTINL